VKLKRELGFWAVFCIAAGAMISSGLFVLPGMAYKIAGPAAVLSYALAALMVIPALLAKSELATAMPRSGGSYFFVERSMGALPGTLAGLAGWFSIALKSAFAMVGIGAFVQLLWPEAGASEWVIRGVAVVCCAVFAVLNVLSVKVAGRVQVALVAALLGVLGVFVVGGGPHVRQHPNFDNFIASGWEAVFATAGLVFVSFGGLTKIAGVAGEVHDPGRNIPRAMILSWVVVSLLYVAAVLVVVGVTDGKKLAAGPYGSLTPVSLAARQFLGRGGDALLAGAAVMAFVTTGNSGILTASRSPLAMGRDGLLPPALSRVSARFGTPHVAILMTGGMMIVMIALLNIRDLVKVASTMMIILFLLENVAVLIMRGSGLRNYRPSFHMPLRPWLPLAGIALYGFLIASMTLQMGRLPLVTTAVFVLAAVLWYVLYVRRRATRESALVYMVRSVVAKDIYRPALEAELREIAIERDGITHDRFDRLVHACPVVDLPGSPPAAEALGLVADRLAPLVGVDRDGLFESLMERERQSSTVIQPGVAIPHIIVPGQNVFALVLVRCREGVRFAGHDEPVRVAFVLAGSADERNFHLRALMAVGQIVQGRDFARRWADAPDAEQLRDILLLSERSRDA